MSDVHRWLSYDELAAARRISKASAARLARRRKWQRRPGNDGTPRVAVPAGEDEPHADDRQDSRQDARPDDRADISRIVSAFEAGLAALRDQVEAERQRADRLQIELARAEDRLRQAEIARLVAAAAERSWLIRRWWWRNR